MVKFNPSLGREAKNRSKTSHAVWQGTAPVRPTPQGETAGEVFSFGEPAMQIANLATTALTMTSREIAELTGKNHADVLRDIRNMLEVLKKDASIFADISLDAFWYNPNVS